MSREAGRPSQSAVVVVTNLFGFPRGYAATNYMSLVARGLTERGRKVGVVITGWTDTRSEPLNIAGSGRIGEIRFKYLLGSPVPPMGRVRRAVRRALRAPSLAATLLAWRLTTRHLTVVIYSRKLTLWKSVWLITRAIGAKAIPYVVEWEPGFPHSSQREERRRERFYHRAFRSSDGVVVISRFLEDRCHEASPKQSCVRVPIACDAARERPPDEAASAGRYALYCGDLENYRLDAKLVIDAVSESGVPDLALILVGRSTPSARDDLMSHAEKAGLTARFTLVDQYVSADALWSLTCGATVLLAPLDDSDRSRARFPSKLADYLLSGRPVVSCAVGEVAEYLRDGSSAFLSSAYTATAFGAKVREAVTGEAAQTVGLAGRDIAIGRFDYRVLAETLDAFFAGLE